MNDGVYRLKFSIGTASETGRLTIDGSRLMATSPGFRLSGTIAIDGKTLSATILVSNAPGSPEQAVQRGFTVLMHGVCDATGLSLIGAGPWGAIIEVNADVEC